MIRKRSSSVAINDERSSNPLPSTNPTGDRSAASASSAGSRSFSLSEPTSRTSIAASRVSSSANMSATSGAYPTRTAACASARPDCPAISTALRRGEVVLHIDGAVRPDGGDADEQSSGPRLFRDGGQRLSATAPAALEARGRVDHPHVVASYASVQVKLNTHSAGGITDKDFVLAAKIEKVVLWHPGRDGGPLEGTPADERFAYIKHDT